MTTRSVSGSPGATGVPTTEVEASETTAPGQDLAGPAPADGVDEHGVELAGAALAGGGADLADYRTPGGFQVGADALAGIDAFEPARDASPELAARTALLFSALDACAPTSVAGHG
jgi:hypothetical protein